VHKCKQDESLFAVMERIVKAEVHRLVVVDEDNKVTGVISLSDILNFLVLRPGGDDPSQPGCTDMFAKVRPLPVIMQTKPFVVSQAVGTVGPWGQVINPEVEEEGEKGGEEEHPLAKSASTDSAVEATEEVLEKEGMDRGRPGEEEKENVDEGAMAGLCKMKADCDIEKLSDLPTSGEETKDKQRSLAGIPIH
jgi:hypothetical protein